MKRYRHIVAATLTWQYGCPVDDRITRGGGKSDGTTSVSRTQTRNGHTIWSTSLLDINAAPICINNGTLRSGGPPSPPPLASRHAPNIKKLVEAPVDVGAFTAPKLSPISANTSVPIFCTLEYTQARAFRA